MKKRVNRREFLRLASIWSVVPFLSKYLNVTDEVDDDEEVPADNLSPWIDGHGCPYYWDGTHAACEDPDCWCKGEPSPWDPYDPGPYFSDELRTRYNTREAFEEWMDSDE